MQVDSLTTEQTVLVVRQSVDFTIDHSLHVCESCANQRLAERDL